MSKSKHQKRVELFMQKAEQELPEAPVIPPYEVRLLRARLIMEEAIETVRALGFAPLILQDMEEFPLVDIENIVFDDEGLKPDLVEIVDGCCDLSVVSIGTLSACGVPDRPFLYEVDDSNLRKFDPGSYKREDGKWIKPPNWRPPQIEKLLEKFSSKE